MYDIFIWFRPDMRPSTVGTMVLRANTVFISPLNLIKRNKVSNKRHDLSALGTMSGIPINTLMCIEGTDGFLGLCACAQGSQGRWCNFHFPPAAPVS